MLSGFNRINKKSSVSVGKKIFADQYSTLDVAIRSIIGVTDALIFTTAVPSTMDADSDGIVSRWNPLNYSNPQVYLTQSVNTKKPALSSTHAVGKYQSVLCALDDSLDTNDNISVNDTIRNTILYFRNIALGTTNHYLFGQYPSGSALASNNYPSLIISGGAAANRVFFDYSWNDGTLRTPYARFFVSNTVTNNSTLFRLLEEIMDPSARTVTASLYSQVKGVLSFGPNLTSSLVSNGSSSIVFSSASVTASDAAWDAQFPQTGFKNSKIFIGPTDGTGQTAYNTIIQTKGTIITSQQMLDLRNVLYRVYGRFDNF